MTKKIKSKKEFVKTLATEIAGIATKAADPDAALMASKFVEEVWQAYSKNHSD